MSVCVYVCMHVYVCVCLLVFVYGCGPRGLSDQLSASGETKDPGAATKHTECLKTAAGGIHVVYVYFYIQVCFARGENGPFVFM